MNVCIWGDAGLFAVPVIPNTESNTAGYKAFSGSKKKRNICFCQTIASV